MSVELQNQFSLEDKSWMAKAIDLAGRAESLGEVPVGAVIVKNNELVAEGWNHPIELNDPTAHAEVMALRAAGQSLSNYRLLETTLYVTLEPCVMCAGAIMHARIGRVVFGASDPKAGAAGSVINLFANSVLNHHVNVQGGLMADKCGSLLTQFFKSKRK